MNTKFPARGNLVNLKGTGLSHGKLNLGNEIFAKTHWPALLELLHDSHVLVHQAVGLGGLSANLDLLAAEWQQEVTRSEAKASCWLWLDVRETGNSVEHVPNRGESLALTLGDVVLHLVLSGNGIGLQGEVVVTNVTASLVDSLELSVGEDLQVGSDGSKVDTLGAALLLLLLGLEHTGLEGGDDGKAHPLLEHTQEHLADLVVHLVTLVPTHVGTGEPLEEGAVSLLVGRDSVDQVAEGSVKATLHLAGILALTDHGLVELAGGIDEILLRDPLRDHAVLVEEAHGLGLNHLLDRDDLVGGSHLVLVHQLAKDALGTLGDRHLVVVVLDEVLHSFGGLVGAGSEHGLGHVEADTAADDGDLGLNGEVDLLDLLEESDQGGAEHLAGIHHGLLGSLAGLLDVLHSLGEVSVLQGSELGDSIVQVGDSRASLLHEGLALLGHLDEGVRVGRVGRLGRLLQRDLDLGHDLRITG